MHQCVAFVGLAGRQWGPDSSYSQSEAKASRVQVLAEALWDPGIWLFITPDRR